MARNTLTETGNPHGPTRRMRRLVRALFLSIVIIGVADVFFMSRYFGAPLDAPDARSDTDPLVPVMSARRGADLLVGLPGSVTLTNRVTELFQNQRMGTAQNFSCAVIRQGGRTLVNLGGTRQVLPASTMKLLTASASLEVLSPGYRMKTLVTANAAPQGGTVAGNLFLIGGGDPLLATKDYLSTFQRQPQIASSMEALADKIVAAGVKNISGDIVGDDTRFDAIRSIETWKPSYVANGEAGPISALSVNDGFIVSQTKLDQYRAKAKRASADPNKKVALPRVVWGRSKEPAQNAAEVLAGLLVERGVTFVGEARSLKAGEKSASQIVVSFDSLPLKQVVAQLLSESDNTTAEILVKELASQTGVAGSTKAGLAVIAGYLKRQEIPDGSVKLYDGSGLDRNNRLTCEILVKAIEGSSDDLRSLFPIGGVSGTLTDRMKGDSVLGKVRAKTGTLNGVSALAGDVESASAGRIEFAVVLNELGPGVLGVATGDQLAMAVAAYPQDIPKGRALPRSLNADVIGPYPRVRPLAAEVPVAEPAPGAESAPESVPAPQASQ